MFSLRAFALVLAAAVIGVFTESSPAALAAASGGAGTSGQLSSNRAVRRQQLTCDPDDPVRGRLSVAYDPGIVTLSGLDFGPGYEGEASVEVRSGSGNGNGATLVSFERFMRGDLGAETGFVQVLFFRLENQSSQPGQIPVARGFTTVDAGGVKGVDTHGLFFDYLPGVADRTVAEYTLFAAEAGERPSDNPEDALIGVGDDGREFRVGPSGITPTTVRGSLIPLPPAVIAGGATLLGIWVVMACRKFLAR